MITFKLHDHARMVHAGDRGAVAKIDAGDAGAILVHGR